MMLADNAARRAGATLALITAAFTAGPAAGQPPLQPLPDPIEVVEAYQTARQWLETFHLPPPDDPLAAVALPSASGVCIIVRYSGRVLATGSAGRGAADDRLMLWSAASEALGGALGHSLIANLPPDLREPAGASLTLELEVAGALVPILNRNLDDERARLDPGLDGLALRRGQRLAMLFPGALLALGQAERLVDLAPSLAAELGLQARDLAALLERENLSLYRFRTIHLAQAAPGRSPFQTVRGQRIVGVDEVTPRTLAATADAIARRIIRALPYRVPAGEAPLQLGVLGDYHLHRDEFQPLLAGPTEQALLAYALCRYAAAPGVDPAVVGPALDTSMRILQAAGVVEAGERDPTSDVSACAAIVEAALEHPQTAADPTVRRLFRDAAAKLVASFHVGVGFVGVEGSTQGDAPIGVHGQALASAALARLLAAAVDERPHPDLVRAAIDTAWRSVPEHRQVSLLPWIAWAERDFAAATARPLAHVEELRRLIDLLDRSRIDPSIPDVSPDLIGGFALSGPDTPVAQPTRATAQGLRPAAFLAAAIRDTHLVPPEAAAGLSARHMLTMRYLVQLTIREDSAWAVRNPHAGLGGVRGSTWDDVLPAAAQAVGLMAAAETLVSLNGANPP